MEATDLGDGDDITETPVSLRSFRGSFGERFE
jgi:hypothetical protein